MKLYLACNACLHEKITNTNFLREDWSNIFTEVEYTDSGYYSFTCQNGHQNFVMLQEQDFEILFQIGANAILDGYYREAISSFTSSLERFYEFCVRVLCLKHGVDNEKLEQCRKFYKNSSDRQISSFLFLYLAEFNSLPFNLKKDEDWRHFRNEVIHKGKIPTKQEALQYGNYVRRFILQTILKLKVNHSNEIQSLVMEHLKNKNEHNVSQGWASVMCTGTIISLANGMIEKNLEKSLEEELDGLQKMRQLSSYHCRPK